MYSFRCSCGATTPSSGARYVDEYLLCVYCAMCIDMMCCCGCRVRALGADTSLLSHLSLLFLLLSPHQVQWSFSDSACASAIAADGNAASGSVNVASGAITTVPLCGSPVWKVRFKQPINTYVNLLTVPLCGSPVWKVRRRRRRGGGDGRREIEALFRY